MLAHSLDTPYRKNQMTSPKKYHDGERVSIVNVNRASRFAIDDKDNIWPIIRFYNLYGDDCPSGEAVACVLGSNDLGWIAIDLSFFKQGTSH